MSLSKPPNIEAITYDGDCHLVVADDDAVVLLFAFQESATSGPDRDSHD